MEKSDDLLGQILSHGPSQGTLLLILTRMKQEGRAREVIQECLKSLERYPDDIRLRILLAESYLEVGFVGQAEEELEKATSMIEDLVSVYKLQAKIYIRQERPEMAADALKRYLAHKGQDHEALELWEQVGEEQGEDIFVGLATPTLAEIYYNQGQIHEAISTYEKVILDKPDDRASIKRLSELKALIKDEQGPQHEDTDELRTKKEKMIEILERWRAKAHDLNHGR